MYTLRTFTMKLQSCKTRTRDILFLANYYMCLVGSFAAFEKNYHTSNALSSTMKLRLYLQSSCPYATSNPYSERVWVHSFHHNLFRLYIWSQNELTRYPIPPFLPIMSLVSSGSSSSVILSSNYCKCSLSNCNSATSEVMLEGAPPKVSAEYQGGPWYKLLLLKAVNRQLELNPSQVL